MAMCLSAAICGANTKQDTVHTVAEEWKVNDMGQALEMCVRCETKRSCDTCTDLHNWIMERLEYEPVKHGKWVFAPNTGPFGRGTWICSRCGKPNFNILVIVLSDPNTGVTHRRAPYTFDGHQYCPHCGARMDEE